MAATENRIQAVLFDLDGTLIETHLDFPAMAAAMRSFASDAGVPPERIAERDILGIVDSAADEIAARQGDAVKFRREAWALLEEMEAEGCSRPNLIPSADILLEHLAAGGIKIAVVTRNCRRVAGPLLARYSLPYDTLLSRDDVRYVKPHPQHLWDALEIMERPPSHAAMVGDHWMDIQAGRKAGCALTAGLLGARADDWFAPCPPDLAIRDLNDLLIYFTADLACHT